MVEPMKYTASSGDTLQTTLDIQIYTIFGIHQGWFRGKHRRCQTDK